MRIKEFNNKNRIKCLMDQNNIKNAPELAKAMYNTGIIQAKDDDGFRRIARSINLHLNFDDDSFEKLSGTWIKRYCDFFHCSADYLLGRPTINWIPTSEKLPEKEGMYLCTFRKGFVLETDIFVLRYKPNGMRFNELKWQLVGEYMPNEYVIAWAELPQPYEDDKTNGQVFHTPEEIAMAIVYGKDIREK